MSVWLSILGWVVGLLWLGLCILATFGFIAILIKIITKNFNNN